MKSNISALVVFCIFGLIIAVADLYTLPVYLTVLPIQYLFFRYAVSLKNFPLLIMEAIWLLSIGIGSTTFFLNRAEAKPVGFRAIGNFDFSYEVFFSVYFFFVLFQIAVLAISKYMMKSTDRHAVLDFSKEEIMNFSRMNNNSSIFPLFIFVVCFSIISIWMYGYHIGMIGLQQTRLPFHLTGILFYCRKFFFTAFLLYLFLKTENKVVGAILLFLYAFIISVTGTSKSLCIMVLIPTAFLCYVNGFKKTMIFVIFGFILIYGFVSETRVIVYNLDASVDVIDLFSSGFDVFFDDFNIGDFLITFVDGFCERLYGMQTAVLTNQYTKIALPDLFDFYTLSATAVDLVPDFTKTLFGIELPDDMAFGVGVGFTGTFTLLTNHSLFAAIVQAVIIGIIFGLQNRFYQNIMYSNKRILKYIVLGLILFGLMGFNDGHTMLSLYESTLLIYITNKFFVKVHKK